MSASISTEWIAMGGRSGTKKWLGESSNRRDALRQTDIRGRRGRGGRGVMELGVTSMLSRQDNDVSSPVPLSGP